MTAKAAKTEGYNPEKYPTRYDEHVVFADAIGKKNDKDFVLFVEAGVRQVPKMVNARDASGEVVQVQQVDPSGKAMENTYSDVVLSIKTLWTDKDTQEQSYGSRKKQQTLFIPRQAMLALGKAILAAEPYAMEQYQEEV